MAARLGIVHYVADERTAFKDIVVRDFVDEYLAGRTPNPCVMCNPAFKFRVLVEWADKLGCDYIATGHYVRVKEEDGHYALYCGVDGKKDQSYFLWRLGQDVLSRCIFPLGAMRKEDVRGYLARKGFEMKARSGESMEICFIDKDYRDFLREQVPDLDRCVGEGKFVDVQGRVIGTHCGFPYFTVGQRKGLGIALGKPAYVLRLNAGLAPAGGRDLGRRQLVGAHPLPKPPDTVHRAPGEEPLSGRRRQRGIGTGAFQGEGFGCDTRPVCRVLRRRQDGGRCLHRFATGAASLFGRLRWRH